MSTTHPVDSTYYPCCHVIGGHAQDCTAIPTVRIRDVDPERRATHAADAIVCRADRLADALLESGWFGCLPDLTAPELQRALLDGRCTDGMERMLDIEIENLSESSVMLPGMTNTTRSSVPAPVGATSVEEGDASGRLFYGATSATIEASGWLREDVTVETGGSQSADGSYEWQVWAGPAHYDYPLTATQARRIGEALIAAADELDALGAAAVATDRRGTRRRGLCRRP